ncbi:aarF domain-containing kinase [Galdieria sulphuraria]|uniref:AarF domain-containing kinase n=1 Tax=Galdieria sulphuraria TaxID=130081 RepID=M2XTA9_GALSU|nr:aarF domain-containing kinase [Galdieria sulphuraria]EME26679.1 aarF domain-containing kinase [Galdieria sulphuraria]|eukprot:XP_005703199.1 aarF domain-containing kinase [Galdieria sulphuraria]
MAIIKSGQPLSYIITSFSLPSYHCAGCKNVRLFGKKILRSTGNRGCVMQTSTVQYPADSETKVSVSNIDEHSSKVLKEFSKKAVRNEVEDDDQLPLVFNLQAITSYWERRQVESRRRYFEVVSRILPFFIKVLLESRSGKLRETETERAIEFREMLTYLGPTFIKLGQSLSIRPDMVGPAAMEELQKLCDAVPPFSTDIALAMIEEELGKSADKLFSEISEKPIAAASLGQVYYAKLKSTGEEVAIKVQRPDMLKKVTLDLYVMRKVAAIMEILQEKLTASRVQYRALLDQWSRSMYLELDYVNEGKNAVRFSKGLQGNSDVYVPRVYFEYTSRRVLTMEWIHGKKLAKSEPAEIRRLVTVGVNCFLNQLLGTGFFHADPHPGNLLVDNKGRLVILDFGLMSEVEKSQMDRMITAIIHLANRDYKKVVDDFIFLGFLPDNVDKGRIGSMLGVVLDQALQGGGAKNINFQKLSSQLSEITFELPFQIPPYFALIIRALSVLEGIALVGNPHFKMIMEAFPYVSNRLLTDDSPYLKQALREILYKNGQFSPKRLRVLVDSAQGFIENGEAFVDFDTPPEVGASTSQVLQFLVSDEGSVIRNLLADEIANGLDLWLRHFLQQLRTSLLAPFPVSIRSYIPLPLTMRLAEPLETKDYYYMENMQQAVMFLLTDRNNVGSETVSPLMLQKITASFMTEEVVHVLPRLIKESVGWNRRVFRKLLEMYLKRLGDEIFAK